MWKSSIYLLALIILLPGLLGFSLGSSNAQSPQCYSGISFGPIPQYGTLLSFSNEVCFDSFSIYPTYVYLINAYLVGVTSNPQTFGAALTNANLTGTQIQTGGLDFSLEACPTVCDFYYHFASSTSEPTELVFNGASTYQGSFQLSPVSGGGQIYYNTTGNYLELIDETNSPSTLQVLYGTSSTTANVQPGTGGQVSGGGSTSQATSSISIVSTVSTSENQAVVVYQNPNPPPEYLTTTITIATTPSGYINPTQDQIPSGLFLLALASTLSILAFVAFAAIARRKGPRKIDFSEKLSDENLARTLSFSDPTERKRKRRG